MEVKSISAVNSAGFRANNANQSLNLKLPPTTGPVNFGCKLSKFGEALMIGKNSKKYV